MSSHLVLANAAKKLAMPSIGLGTYMLNGKDGQNAIDLALHHGYRYLDTATRYGNEQDIGEVVKARINSGHLTRNGLFITTKVPSVYLAKKDVRDSLESSLEKLKTNYVDMFLIHYPWGNKNRGDGETQPVDEKGDRELDEYDLNDTWATMEELVREGKASAIGLSNFSPRLIDNIWEKAKIKPANLQCECHVYLNQANLLSYCNSRNIVMTAYAPFGAPLYPNRAPGTPLPLEDDTVKNIATKHHKTPGQVLLRHLIQRNIAVIPKSETEERLKENIDVYDFNLGDGDMKMLNSLDKKLKFFRFEWAKAHPLYKEGEDF